MSGKFALIIANTEYTDPGLAKLTAPGKDAEEFARVLKSPDIAAFDDVHVLINENATIARESIDDFFARKTPDDLLVLFFSGHGVRDEFGSLYLAVKNTNRDLLRSTAINSSFIREGMDQSRSRRQVLILDCCNSGAFAQGTKAQIGGSVGTASAFEGTGYGRVVLTASDSTQFAWEGDKVIGETTNSLFTHFLVQGLEGDADRNGDGIITVDELYDYAYEQIISRTPKQTPGKWSYKQQGDIVLRQNIRIEDTKPIPLPDELIEATKSSLPFIREGAVRQLEALLIGKNRGLARSARLALRKIAEEDDSRRVSQIAADILEPIRSEKDQDTKKAEKEQKTLEQNESLEAVAQEKKEREPVKKIEYETAEKEVIEKVVHEEEEKKAQEEKMSLLNRLYEQAKNRMVQMDWSGAGDLLIQIHDIDPEFQDVADLLKQVEDERNRQEKFSGLVARGKGLLEKQKWTEAIRVFKQALDLDSGNKEVQTLLTKAETGEKIKALFDTAHRHVQAEQWSDAIAKFQAILKLEPTNVKANRRLTAATIRLAQQREEQQNESNAPPRGLSKPISFPEEIKSSRPTSLPEAIKPRGKPKDLPK